MRFCVVLVTLLLASASVTASSRRPNVLLILTDDLDLSLGGLTPLSKTRAWLAGKNGAELAQAFVSTPVCCPSRASILTGMYMHNTGVVNNSVSGHCASAHWQSAHEPRTFGAQLADAGYRTFYAGKYMNEYGTARSPGNVTHVPVGWHWWRGLVGNSQYYDYDLSVDGVRESHGHDYHNDYLTDLIGRQALEFIDDHLNASTESSNSVESTSPFLMVLSTPSAHAPFTPAPHYGHAFPNVTAPRTAAFNYVAEDKHWLVSSDRTPMTDKLVDTVDEVFRNRLRTLLSVDDVVDSVMARLESTGLLDDTFVVFTSDHGYHLGQFTRPVDKRLPYDTDLRVPLLVRGPGVRPGLSDALVVITTDLASTILDMAGVDAPDYMDGRSFLPVIREDASSPGPFFSSRTSFLVEYSGEGGEDVSASCPHTDPNVSHCVPDYDCKCQDARNNTYLCVRTVSRREDSLYCRFADAAGFVEAYDLAADPFQLRNVAWPRWDSAGSSGLMRTPRAYERRMSKLRSCRGRRQCQAAARAGRSKARSSTARWRNRKTADKILIL